MEGSINKKCNILSLHQDMRRQIKLDVFEIFKKIISEIICNKNYLNEINEGYVHHFKAFALEEE